MSQKVDKLKSQLPLDFGKEMFYPGMRAIDGIPVVMMQFRCLDCVNYCKTVSGIRRHCLEKHLRENFEEGLYAVQTPFSRAGPKYAVVQVEQEFYPPHGGYSQIQDTRVKDTRVQDTRVQDSRVQASRMQDTRVQNTRVQNTRDYQRNYLHQNKVNENQEDYPDDFDVGIVAEDQSEIDTVSISSSSSGSAFLHQGQEMEDLIGDQDELYNQPDYTDGMDFDDGTNLIKFRKQSSTKFQMLPKFYPRRGF